MNGSASVLVVDDDVDVRMLVKELLTRAGYRVTEAPDGRAALRALYDERPDLVVLDVSMPEIDGWGTLERIRELSDVPVVMLSAFGAELEKVRALRGGADDYVTKPFGSSELVARLSAALRRAHPAETEEPVLSADGLHVDLPARRVTRDGRDVHLTPIEFDLLRALVRNRGRLMTHRLLLREVWGRGYEEDTQVLRVHIANLRRKIEVEPGNPSLIKTDPGVGYRFAA
jgi:two-component system, OmpR family, KDP operon response regulator KdpE